MSKAILPLSLLYLLTMATLCSCRNESRESASDATRDNVAEDIAADIGAPLPSLPYVAVFDDTSEQLKAEKNPDFDNASLDADALTQALIANYPEIKPTVDRISHDTLYLHITDAQYLTQQMGSSGAEMYLLEATYAYTELPVVEVVHFHFAEGDHAVPGNYTRDSFKKLTDLRTPH